jgi:Domain of unknown function (DUF4262)
MKHSNTGKCRCHRCASIAAGATPAEADAEYREWEQLNLLKHGWIVHLVGDDSDSPTGFNLHTHGLRQNYDHPDFQIVIPLPEKIGHALMITLANRVKAGERFEAGQTVTELLGNGMLVKLIDATECGRTRLVNSTWARSPNRMTGSTATWTSRCRYDHDREPILTAALR